MSCCCKKVYRLCDLVVCDDLDLVLPVPITVDGEYTLELDFLDDLVRKTAMLGNGDMATFDKVDLNERFTYVGRVVGPDGNVVKFTVDEVEYDCVEFTTKLCVLCPPSTASSSSSSSS